MTSAPISLYLELEPDQIADLEVVANASLAFVKALREVAYQIDPSLEIRVEIDSGTKGSLSINARIRALQQKYLNRNVLLGVTGVLLVYFKEEIRDHVVDKALDAIFPGFVEEHFSDRQKQEIKTIIDDSLKKNIGRKEAGKVYQELEKDPAVKGVGATTVPSTKPDNIVPRAEFSRRAAEAPPVETTVRKRDSNPTVTVTLIKPVLEHSKRSWRLKSASGEFGAVMEDTEFLDDVLSEKIRIPMIEGIQLTVTLHVEEELGPQGVWEITSRKITKVHGFERAPTQQMLKLIPQLRPSVNDDEKDEH